MKTAHTLLLLAVAWHFAIAQPLEQPVAARYLPLGAYSRTQADIYAARSNAAALAQLQQPAAAFYAEQRFGLAHLNAYAFSGGLRAGQGAIALHGYVTGFSLLQQHQLSLAYGMKLGARADAGIQLNYYGLQQGNGYGSAFNINASAGALFHLSSGVHTGFHIHNPLGSRWSKGSGEKLPARYTFGWGYEASEAVFASGEVIKEENQPPAVNAGLQYRFSPLFFARAGVSTATGACFFGIGFQFHTLRADIAAGYQSPLGISSGLLLLFSPGKQKTQAAEQPIL